MTKELQNRINAIYVDLNKLEKDVHAEREKMQRQADDMAARLYAEKDASDSIGYQDHVEEYNELCLDIDETWHIWNTLFYLSCSMSTIKD